MYNISIIINEKLVGNEFNLYFGISLKSYICFVNCMIYFSAQ